MRPSLGVCCAGEPGSQTRAQSPPGAASESVRAAESVPPVGGGRNSSQFRVVGGC